MTVTEKMSCLDPVDEIFSIRKQAGWLGIPRSSYYYHPAREKPENLLLMDLIDKAYTQHPYYGSRRILAYLIQQGYKINRKRVQRLMSIMGLVAIYPKRNLSKPQKDFKKYPYLLRGLDILSPNQVWSTDITFIRLKEGFMYLTVVIDWYSRYVLSWRLSNTLEGRFCIEALEEALSKGKPDIFNTDQGVQYTSEKFTKELEERGIRISMDGKGRALDNIFIERLWRTIKYEEIYLKEYESARGLAKSLRKYFDFYNKERFHQSLGYKTPEQVHLAM